MNKSQIEKETELEIDEVKLANKLLFITINDLLNRNNAKNSNRAIAEQWLYSDDNFSEFTFSDVCQILFLDKSQLRFLLNSYQDKNKKWIVESEFDKILLACRKKYSCK